MQQRFSRSIPSQRARDAVVIGAGSFGTAIAVLLARAGFRTVLQTRTDEHKAVLEQEGENSRYLPGVDLPAELRIETVAAGPGKAELVFLGVPSKQLHEVIAQLHERGLNERSAVISLAKGLTRPAGEAPSTVLMNLFDASRVAVIGGPAHAREMVSGGAGLVAGSTNLELARRLAEVFSRAGVVCEPSPDPVGVELAGVAKNAAALAAGATVPLGLNAAGAAAGHIFLEVWRYAHDQGARPESFIGLAGTGDLVATALAPQSRNRRAGELLAKGTPSSRIEAEVGQAVEALDMVPLLSRALENANIDAPITRALNRLIAGELPVEEWVALVRTTVPVSLKPRTRIRRWFQKLLGRR